MTQVQTKQGPVEKCPQQRGQMRGGCDSGLRRWHVLMVEAEQDASTTRWKGARCGWEKEGPEGRRVETIPGV